MFCHFINKKIKNNQLLKQFIVKGLIQLLLKISPSDIFKLLVSSNQQQKT